MKTLFIWLIGVMTLLVIYQTVPKLGGMLLLLIVLALLLFASKRNFI